jgi:hypothetical protein
MVATGAVTLTTDDCGRIDRIPPAFGPVPAIVMREGTNAKAPPVGQGFNIFRRTKTAYESQYSQKRMDVQTLDFNFC